MPRASNHPRTTARYASWHISRRLLFDYRYSDYHCGVHRSLTVVVVVVVVGAGECVAQTPMVDVVCSGPSFGGGYFEGPALANMPQVTGSAANWPARSDILRSGNNYCYRLHYWRWW
ncbi:hypothetical protein M434DRAFT_8030 [Hypoxylon sp. CO27-5]|nr:hypothetical protein M434DRAFT_8030 [Hypoxylon sp. CO27-5]